VSKEGPALAGSRVHVCFKQLFEMPLQSDLAEIAAEEMRKRLWRREELYKPAGTALANLGHLAHAVVDVEPPFLCHREGIQFYRCGGHRVFDLENLCSAIRDSQHQ
jgi:hypothetical protein